MEALSLERPPLPYYASEETLPAHLPTVDEIRETGVDMNWTPDTAVTAVGEHFVVKYGPKVWLQEGENMLFVLQTTRIRIPTVYAFFEHDGAGYIIMERVRGEFLHSCWNELNEEVNANVTGQLKRYFDELRRVEPPEYYGGIWEQQVLDPCLSHRPSWGSEERVVKPMQTEEEWVEKMLEVLQNTGPKLRDDLRDKWLPYCQLDWVVTVIDWEFSGWCPAWWEWCVACMDRPERGFSAMVGEFLDAYPEQLDCVESIRKDVKGE